VKGVGTYGLKSIVGRSDSWYEPDDEPWTEAEYEEAHEAWWVDNGSDPDENSAEWSRWLEDFVEQRRNPDYD
jgi:hypothetical protein